MPKEKDESKKKCAGTGVSIKRSKRYYRDGKYFLNKNAYHTYLQKQKEAAEAK
jgi:hypothetical protein